MAFGATVKISADVGQFVSSLDKATGGLNKFKSSADTIAGQINRTLGAIGLGVSLAGITSYVTSIINLQDHLKDLSKTTQLPIELLAGLSSAATKSGSDIDGTAKAINKLSKEMGINAEKFAEIGITAKDPFEAFLQLTDVINGIEDPQRRAAVATEALGKGWESAAPLIAEGSASIREMVDSGTKMSKITKESADRADAFNEKLTDLKTISAGLAIDVFDPIIGGILDISNAFGVAETAGDRFKKSLQITIAGVGGVAKRLLPAPFGDIADKGAAAAFAALQPSGSASSRDTGIRKIGGASPSVSAPTTAALDEFINGPKKTGGGKKTGAKQKDEIDDVTKALQGIAKEWSELGKSGSELEIFRLKTMGATDAQLALAESMLKTIDNHEEEVKALEAGRKAFEAEQEAMTAAMIARDEKITEFTRKASENIQTAMSDFLFDPFAEGLGGMLDGFTTMLRRMAAEAAAADIARRLFGSGVGSGGGILGPIINAGLGYFGMGGTQAPAPVETVVPKLVGSFATGTDYVPRTGLALVHQGERIIPADQNARSGAVVINFAISGSVDSRTQTQIAAQAGSAVQRAMRRNG